MNSNTRVQFEENLTAFIEAFSDQQELLSLEQYQLVHREHFVKAWINQYRHYGVTTTSPLEGIHSIIKRWLATSTNDLLGAVDTLKVMLSEQHSYIRNSSGTPTPTEFSHDISRSCKD